MSIFRLLQEDIFTQFYSKIAHLKILINSFEIGKSTSTQEQGFNEDNFMTLKRISAVSKPDFISAYNNKK